MRGAHPEPTVPVIDEICRYTEEYAKSVNLIPWQDA